MHTFEVLGEPIRRRIVEILACGEHQAGVIEEIVAGEFGVGRSAAQHHLRVLRDHEWIIVRAEENERHYRLDPRVIPRLEKQVRRLRKLWNRRIGWVDEVEPRLPRVARGSGQVVRARGNGQVVRARAAAASVSSKRGLRGHGRDPDDPWRHPELWAGDSEAGLEIGG
jgi:DNA-binding transcriptional ArsR family regulator